MNSLKIITALRFAVQRSECGTWYGEHPACWRGHFFTDVEPKVANDGSTESCDQGLLNDVLMLVCGEVLVAYSILHCALWNAMGTFSILFREVSSRDKERR